MTKRLKGRVDQRERKLVLDGFVVESSGSRYLGVASCPFYPQRRTRHQQGDEEGQIKCKWISIILLHGFSLGVGQIMEFTSRKWGSEEEVYVAVIGPVRR